MFKQKTVKAFSVVAILLSVIGILISTAEVFLLKQSLNTVVFILGMISWGFLLWASILGYKLCTNYKLYDEEYKKVGIRIYLIILAFILYIFVGLTLGLLLSLLLLGSLSGLKRNYDEWDKSSSVYEGFPEAVDKDLMN